MTTRSRLGAIEASRRPAVAYSVSLERRSEAHPGLPARSEIRRSAAGMTTSARVEQEQPAFKRARLTCAPRSTAETVGQPWRSRLGRPCRGPRPRIQAQTIGHRASINTSFSISASVSSIGSFAGLWRKRVARRSTMPRASGTPSIQ